MSNLTRRQLIKSSISASAVSLVSGLPLAAEQKPVAGVSADSDFHAAGIDGNQRERFLLDGGWKFALGNADDQTKDFGWGELATGGGGAGGGGGRTFAKSGNIGPATAKLDDSNWRSVDLPHDWGIELPFIGTPPLPKEGGHPLGRDYATTSIGWYRKRFELSAADKDKRIQIEFDGVFGNSIIFLNGHYLMTNLSGYTPFMLDVTDWVNVGTNLLTVRVDATLGSGWFYEGAGIYRHVWLIKSNPVHLVEWGTYVRSTVAGRGAKISLGSEVRNDSGQARKIHVRWEILDSTGTHVATVASPAMSIPAWQVKTFEAHAALDKPNLWSIETPTLYRAVASVHSAGAVVDSDGTTFGIRSTRFDAGKGFFLNEKPVRLNGTCCHQDHAGLGVALPDRVQYYRIERLKSMNSNALRTAHNPPTPALMDATDALGMMVLCETRMMDSSPEGLSQLERMIRRLRNHPSIFMWSLGNEEYEEGTERGAKIVATMMRLAHELDPTRPCTTAMTGSGWGSGVSRETDVQGLNYSYGQIDKFHEKFPDKPCIGTETGAVRSTRGVYQDDKERGYMSAYDSAARSMEWWSFYDRRPWLSGSFVWSGFDFGGEPSPFKWPVVVAQSGSMDSCGFPKDIYYYYKSWWGTEPVLHVFPHWNWPKEKQNVPVDIRCYTNLDSVELFVNDKSQGIQQVARNGHAEWKVPYAPGSIEVRGSKDGKVILSEKRETTGDPARIVLRPDRQAIHADGADVAMITIEVQDLAGRVIPVADNEITFEVSGPGKLIGHGNGCPSSHVAEKGTTRKVFMGLAQAIVQTTDSPGTIIVKASGAALAPATLNVDSILTEPRPAL